MIFGIGSPILNTVQVLKIDLSGFPFDYGTAVSNPTASEGSRSFRLDNQSAFIVRRWAIDKVVFENRNEERCDYLIEVQNPKKTIYYWIELKGKDIIKACRQITSCIDLINVSEDIRQHARIITSGTNQLEIRSNDYSKLKLRMKKTGGHLKTYTNYGSEII